MDLVNFGVQVAPESFLSHELRGFEARRELHEVPDHIRDIAFIKYRVGVFV